MNHDSETVYSQRGPGSHEALASGTVPASFRGLPVYTSFPLDTDFNGVSARIILQPALFTLFTSLANHNTHSRSPLYRRPSPCSSATVCAENTSTSATAKRSPSSRPSTTSSSPFRTIKPPKRTCALNGNPMVAKMAPHKWCQPVQPLLIGLNLTLKRGVKRSSPPTGRTRRFSSSARSRP